MVMTTTNAIDAAAFRDLARQFFPGDRDLDPGGFGDEKRSGEHGNGIIPPDPSDKELVDLLDVYALAARPPPAFRSVYSHRLSAISEISETSEMSEASGLSNMSNLSKSSETLRLSGLCLDSEPTAADATVHSLCNSGSTGAPDSPTKHARSCFLSKPAATVAADAATNMQATPDKPASSQILTETVHITVVNSWPASNNRNGKRAGAPLAALKRILTTATAGIPALTADRPRPNSLPLPHSYANILKPLGAPSCITHPPSPASPTTPPPLINTLDHNVPLLKCPHRSSFGAPSKGPRRSYNGFVGCDRTGPYLNSHNPSISATLQSTRTVSTPYPH